MCISISFQSTYISQYIIRPWHQRRLASISNCSSNVPWNRDDWGSKSVDKYRNRDKLVVVTSLKIVISKQCKSKTWLKDLYSEFWKSKSLRVATVGMKCINSAWCKTTRSGWLYKDNRGSLYKFQAVYRKWLYECQSISSSGFHHFYSPQT